ncbi:MAG: HAD-IIA family hydrolase [Nitrososphaerota archaeon]
MSRVEAVLMDVDGTLFLGDTPITGASRLVERLREWGLRILFLTNNSFYSRRMLLDKMLSVIGDARLEDVLNSGLAASEYLRERRGACRVFVVGDVGLVEEMILGGHQVVGRSEDADAVVAGGTKDISYWRLVEGHRAILKGALFIATNKDHIYMTERGPMPGAGALISFLETSTRREAVLVGKPARYIGDLALRRLGLTPSEVVVVGDNEEVDMALAQNIGSKGILVLTGISRNPSSNNWLAAKNLDEVAEKLSTLL